MCDEAGTVRHVIARLLLGTTVALTLLPGALLTASVAAQRLAGDVNGDGVVTPEDLGDLASEVFDGDGDNVSSVADGDFSGAPGADANDDGRITGADFPQAVYFQPGLTPAVPTATATQGPPTATRTPTPTPTLNLTPATATPSPTSTACASQAIVPTKTPGTIVGGSLDAGDCVPVGTSGRLGDVYSVAGNPGQAITIRVSSSSFTPKLLVLDASGYFGVAEWNPVEFLVTTTRPYQFVVTSAASGAMTGSYTLAVSVRNCPAVRSISPSTNGTRLTASISESDCPEPAVPNDPADLYTFTMAAGTTVSVLMHTDDYDELVHPDPFLDVYGPASPGGFTGIRLASDYDSGLTEGDPDDEFDDDYDDALLFFYAAENGTYTVVASGGEGSYSITFARPACPVSAVAVSNERTTLSGLLTDASCPSPLPLPWAESGAPNGRADVRTIAATAGDVLAAKLSSSDFDAQLYLLGPEKTLLASDNDGSEDGLGNAQLAFTVAQAGTYTLVAASNDPFVPVGSGMTGEYALELQKCPATPLLLNAPTAADFTSADCRGSGGASVDSYKLSGTAGQFVTVTMSDPTMTIDALLELLDPNGHLSRNDDDPFLSSTGTDARVSRVLPKNGTYIVTATSSPDVAAGEGAYTLLAQRCPTTAVTAGTVTGSFKVGDCMLSNDDGTSGPRLNVFTIETGASRALSVVPPAGMCALILTPDGLQGPAPECLSAYLAMPVVEAGTSAVMLAAPDPNFLGSYTFDVRSCTAAPLSYSASVFGFLTAGNCREAAGFPAAFHLFRAPRSLTVSSDGVTGRLTSTFTGAPLVIDNGGMFSIEGRIDELAEGLFAFGSDLVFLLEVRPATPNGSGTYTLSIDPAVFHQ